MSFFHINIDAFVTLFTYGIRPDALEIEYGIHELLGTSE